MLLSIISGLLLVSCFGGGSDSATFSVPANSCDSNLQAQFCESSLSFTDGDPLAGCSWFLNNTGQNSFAAAGGSDAINSEFIDLNMINTAANYTGQGVKVAVSDSGLEITHEDLVDNVLLGQSKNYNISPPYFGNPGIEGTDGDHGTSVAGIIAARDNNQKGGRGIASRASIVGLNFINSAQSLAIKIDQADGNYDIFNQSWGLVPNSGNDVIEPSYLAQLKSGVETLRSGKGAIYVKASGNSFNQGVNSNMDPYNTNPYTIVVGSITASGVSASYSQGCSCNLISAPGGEFGINEPAIITTDVMGGLSGYSKGELSFLANTFEDGNEFNPTCSYTSTFNGTSSAAPMVSGAVALMLEANPNLEWRDVRHILISTAKKIHASVSDFDSNLISSLPPSPSGHTWEQGWRTNDAGYDFHNWYGFGTIDIDAAVAMAETYSVDLQVYNESVTAGGDWAYTTGDIMTAIPDNSSTGVTEMINVTHNMTVESVQLRVNITHPHSGDIGIELTSPNGTKSILLNVNNYFKAANNIDNMVLISNMFYGESSMGTWAVKVIDGAQDDTGEITRIDMKINGRAATQLTF